MFSDPALAPPQARAGAPAPLHVTRARSVEREARLVAAARELADERHSAGFTVHEVAARAGSSLKGFYRCFAGKDDLLVALLAAESHVGAAVLSERIAASATPAARLRTAVTGLLDLSTVAGAEGYARVLVSEHRRLSQGRPDELGAALAPIVDVIATEIEEATGRGAAASATPRRDALTVFSLVLDGIHAVAFGRAEVGATAEHLWQFCGRALGATAPDREAP
jgi:AcrR family transcriptional regulator